MNCWQKTQTQKILGTTTEASLVDALSKVASELGFDHFSVYLRLPLPVTRPTVVILDNYPQAWRDHYWKRGYDAVDPILVHGHQSIVPVIWYDHAYEHPSKNFWQDASDHGLQSGFSHPAHGPGGIRSVLSLGCTHQRIDSNELRTQSFQLSWLAHATNQSMSNLLKARLVPHGNNRLTPRELEVLRWTADGKTASEVGSIMAISERTVNFHVGNSLIKLDSTNKTAAVIKAAMLGLL